MKTYDLSLKSEKHMIKFEFGKVAVFTATNIFSNFSTNMLCGIWMSSRNIINEVVSRSLRKKKKKNSFFFFLIF